MTLTEEALAAVNEERRRRAVLEVKHILKCIASYQEKISQCTERIRALEAGEEPVDYDRDTGDRFK